MDKLITINSNQVFIHNDVPGLIESLKHLIHTSASARRDIGSRFYLALAGGSTPKRLYQSLAVDPHLANDLWKTFEIYFGDERYVHHTSADSNYRMVKQAWLDDVPIPAAQIHPIPTHCDDIDTCADDYARTIGAIPADNGLPCFDMILLGMGDDGHTASLFPGTPVLEEKNKYAASVFVEKLQSHRITLTYPVINNASQVIVMVTGQGKADTLKQVLTEPARQYPIQRINNPNGVIWFIDQDAARELD